MGADGDAGVVDDRGRVFTGDGHRGPRRPGRRRRRRSSPARWRSTRSSRSRRSPSGRSPCWPPTGGGPSAPAPRHRCRPIPSRDTPGVRFTERMAGWRRPGPPTAIRTVGAAQGEVDGTPPRVRAHDRDRRPPGDARRPRHPGPAQRHGRGPRGVAPPPAGRRRLVPPGAGGPHPRRHLAHALLDAAGGRRRAAVPLRGPQGPARPLRPRPVERHHHAVRDDQRRARTRRWRPASCASRPPTSPASSRRCGSPASTAGPSGLRWMARFGGAVLPLADQRLRQPRRRRRLPGGARRAGSPLTGAGHRRLRLPAPEPRWCDGAGRWHEGDGQRRRPRLGWLRLVRYEGGRRGTGAAGGRVRHVGHVVPGRHRRHQPGRAPGRARLRRLAVRLPGQHRPAVGATPFTLDDIARADWPAAVAEVRRVTGAEQRAGARPLRRLGLAADGAGATAWTTCARRCACSSRSTR